MRRCNKRRYRDEIAAKLALEHISYKDHRREKNESRCYRCNMCKGYHLTSVPYREKVVSE
jgi:hypothetical protein